MLLKKRRKKFVRLISASLVLSMLMPLSSCGKKKEKKVNKITSDTPWFEAEIIDVDSWVPSDKEVSSLYTQFVGSDDKYYVVYLGGEYKTPAENEADASSFNDRDYDIYVACVIDKESGKVVNTIDLDRDTDKRMFANEFVSAVVYVDGKITATANTKERDYDPLTGELLETRTISAESGYFNTQYYNVGGYTVATIREYADDGSGAYNFRIKSPDGTEKKARFYEWGTSVYLESILPESKTTATVFTTTSKGRRVFKLDLVEGELTEINAEKYAWLDFSFLYGTIVGSDGKIYGRSVDGIGRIDMDEKKLEKVFDYNWCGLNRGIMDWNLSLAECGGDTYTFIGKNSLENVYSFDDQSFQIVRLKKAKENPHVGKTVLELYVPFLTKTLGEAIKKFNETSDKDFIIVSDRYKSSDYEEDLYKISVDDSDAYQADQLNLISVMGNDLALDILSGEGPDILIDTTEYARLNTSEYLLDLSPYVKDSDPEQYFTNIIDCVKTDGSIYQLPVSFSLRGILTDASKAGDSGKGFTFEEYPEFIKQERNGVDVIDNGQALYFANLFQAEKEKFYKDGKLDLSAPEFARMADFVKYNVPKKGGYSDKVDEEYQGYVDYTGLSGLGSFFLDMRPTSKIKDPTLLGDPSSDGRGPQVFPRCSVAISANTADPDGCGEFVKTLLSEDMQENFAMSDCFVLNRKALRSVAEDAITYYNDGGSISGYSFSFGGMRHVGDYYSMKDVEKAEKLLSTCSGILYEDADISMILIEEMPAYFEGQKDLAQVSSTIENRARQVLNERK